MFDFVEVIFKMAEVFGAPSLKKILKVVHFGGLVDMQSYLIGSVVGPSGLLGQYFDWVKIQFSASASVAKSPI
jgi:hypothetical protein